MTERQIVQSGPRPRYGRLAAASSALAITLVTLLGGLGLLPDGSSATASSRTKGSPESASLSAATIPDSVRSVRSVSPKATPASEAEPRPSTTGTATPETSLADTWLADTSLLAARLPAARLPAARLPAASGTGRRVVFDMSDQRVWLVDPGNAKDEVLSTYLVSGSLTSNLNPGTYEVYSQSRRAVGIDDSGVMQYFVRFTRGANAAIGFHSIPTKDGRPLQTKAQLGSPQSHGCIRQALPDAKRLWAFAPVGTIVVVTA